MNILLITSDLALGGAQQVVINLANELIKQNNNVWIFDVKPEIRNIGMTERINQDIQLISKNYSEFNLSLKGKFVDFIFNLFKIRINKKKYLFIRHKQNLKKTLLNNKIDYVNSHVCWADFFVYDNLKNFHNRWIISLHASYNALFSKEKNVKKYVDKARKSLTSAKKIIYLHKDGVELLEKKTGIKISNKRKIYNGIPLPNKKIESQRRKLKINKNDFVILCGSRASKFKGWYELAEAVVRLNNSSIKLIFAGDGEILKDIKIKFSKYKSNIFFLGFKKDIASLISISNVVCLPSYTEALPNILIESTFYNKPVIATDVGESKIILKNQKGKCGILIKPKKSEELVDELIIAIKSIIEKKTTFNIEAFNRARVMFSVKKMAKNYLDYFNES